MSIGQDVSRSQRTEDARLTAPRPKARAWRADSPGDVSALQFVPVDVPAPRSGEVTIRVRAAGMNPADYKSLSWGGSLPLKIGSEISGVVTAVGADTRTGTGTVEVGDAVLAFRVQGGYATDVTVNARDVFAKPPTVPFEQAANLLLAGTAAAEMVHLTGVRSGDTILVHGASGAVGLTVVQLAVEIGARVIGTASTDRWDQLKDFGAVPVLYGPGLEERVRRLAPHGIDASLDCVGTDEAVDVSLSLVADRRRIVTSAAIDRAHTEGFQSIGGTAASVEYRDAVRPHLIALAGTGRLVVPVVRTFALDDAVAALRVLQSGQAGGKLALVNEEATGR